MSDYQILKYIVDLADEANRQIKCVKLKDDINSFLYYLDEKIKEMEGGDELQS
jgi:hypothetical protein